MKILAFLGLSLFCSFVTANEFRYVAFNTEIVIKTDSDKNQCTIKAIDGDVTRIDANCSWELKDEINISLNQLKTRFTEKMLNQAPYEEESDEYHLGIKKSTDLTVIGQTITDVYVIDFAEGTQDDLRVYRTFYSKEYGILLFSFHWSQVDKDISAQYFLQNHCGLGGACANEG